MGISESEVFFMKTITCSDRVYYDELLPEEAQAIRQDIQLVHSILHTAYRYLTLKARGIPFPFEESLHKELKRRYHTNDYFPLTALWEAQHQLKADFENHERWKKSLKARVKSVEKKIRKTEKEIQRLDKQLAQLKQKTKQGKQTQEDYLLEVQGLRPTRKQLKNRRSQLIFKLNRTQQQLNTANQKMRFTCFGGKKLSRSRTTVYAGNHEAWLEEYRYQRNKTMMIPGRRQGKYSNCLFKYHLEEGVLIYRCSSENREIRLKVRFHANAKELERAVKLPHNTPGKAVAYLLEDHKKYFIIKAVVEMEDRELMENKQDGVIGIDINADHIAVSETDACGNCVLLKTVPMPLRGKTKNQRKHQIRQTAKEVVLECVRSNKPLVMEALDFEKKKSNMRYGNQKHNQMLSEFATKQIQEAIERRCWKEGYGTYRVNPAYTSQIGREKYSRKMGCTVHLAASFVIARRGMGYQN